MELEKKKQLITDLTQVINPVPPKQNEHKLPDSGDTTFDAGTGTLYIRERDVDYDDAKAAISYKFMAKTHGLARGSSQFESKIARKHKSITEKNKQEAHFCEFAIFCIKKCFGI